MISQLLLTMLKGVAWARQVDVRLWETQGRWTPAASAERPWGCHARKDSRVDGTRPSGLDHLSGVLDGDFSRPEGSPPASPKDPRRPPHSYCPDQNVALNPQHLILLAFKKNLSVKGGQLTHLFFANSFCWSSAFILTLSTRGHGGSGTFPEESQRRMEMRCSFLAAGCIPEASSTGAVAHRSPLCPPSASRPDLVD